MISQSLGVRLGGRIVIANVTLSFQAVMRWLPIAALLAMAGCGVIDEPGRPSISASTGAAVGRRVPLPAEERAALLHAAEGALKRSPDPLPVVHVEGTLPTLPSYQRALQARKDWAAMEALASAYIVDRDTRYVEGYARYLSAWLDVYKVSGNPIDETRLAQWLLAYRSAGAALPSGLSERMRQFACDLAIRYTQPQPASRKTSTNNWQSHRVKLAVMGAHVCGEAALITAAEAAFAKQIDDNLLANGETVDFAERDAIHYVVYSVEPLLEAALFARLHGRPLFAITGRDGQSISRTLEWLAPYARGEKTHEEFVHSRVRFDAERAAAGVPGFSGPFLPKSAQWTYWLAAQMDGKWLEVSRKLGNPSITQRAPWLEQLLLTR